jgi:hypothetical protein
MKTRSIVAGLATAAALSAGAVGAAAAQSNPSTPTTAPTTTGSGTADSGTADRGTTGSTAGPTGARRQFACGHQHEIEDLQAQRKALLGDRLALLKEARQTAVAAGEDAWVVRIDNHIARVAKAQEQVETRAQRFTTWVGAHCGG